MIPNQTAIEAAASQVHTPCYYFCGPWYTWLWTWVLGAVAIVVLAAPVLRWWDEDDK